MLVAEIVEEGDDAVLSVSSSHCIERPPPRPEKDFSPCFCVVVGGGGTVDVVGAALVVVCVIPAFKKLIVLACLLF